MLEQTGIMAIAKPVGNDEWFAIRNPYNIRGTRIETIIMIQENEELYLNTFAVLNGDKTKILWLHTPDSIAPTTPIKIEAIPQGKTPFGLHLLKKQLGIENDV